MNKEKLKENCCTPEGQIKRYIDCKGCDRKPKQETLEEITANLADPNLCKTDNWIAGAKWMLEKLQDFDTWKEWKDINFKSE